VVSAQLSIFLQKKRNRLEITDRGDLRLNLTNLKPNIENLLSKHQAHPSHIIDIYFKTNLDFFFYVIKFLFTFIIVLNVLITNKII